MKQAPRIALPLALLCVTTFAQAHPGTDAGAHHGFVEGFVHPFTGADHCAAMLAVGLWSARDAGRRWLAPLAFMAMLLAGALLALAGVQFAAVETGIAASLLALGALLFASPRLGAGWGALLVGGFALFHGAAHGQELGAGAALAGMVLATACLHGLGIGLGVALQRRAPWAARAAGAGIALLGLGLLA